MDPLLRSGLGLFAAVYEQLAMAPAAAALREQLLFSADSFSSSSTSSSSSSSSAAAAALGEWTRARDAVDAAGAAGLVAGQLAFGLAGDAFGRRRPLLVASALLALGAVLSAAATSAAGSEQPSHLVAMLATGRALAGLGAGGEFPLSAAATAEHNAEDGAGARTRRVVRLWALSVSAAGVAAAFLGNLLAQALAMGDPGENARARLEVVWRLELAAGAAPAALACYYRLAAAEGEDEPAAFARARDKGHVPHQRGAVATVLRPGARLRFVARHYWRPLLGAAGAWMAWGVLAAAPTLLARRLLLAVVADAAAATSTDDGWGLALQTWTAQNAFSALLALPGLLLAPALTPSGRLGRARLQLAGFSLLALDFLALALLWTQVAPAGDEPTAAATPAETALLLTALLLAGLAGVGGPGVTTFVLPTEMFPAAIASSCFGVAAAAGSLGAALGALVLLPALQTTVRGASAAFAAVAALGAAVTWLACADCDLSFDERDEQMERRLLRDAAREHQRRSSALVRSRPATGALATAELGAPGRWRGALSTSSSDQQDTLEITERVRRRFAIDSGEVAHYEALDDTPKGSAAAATAPPMA